MASARIDRDPIQSLIHDNLPPAGSLDADLRLLNWADLLCDIVEQHGVAPVRAALKELEADFQMNAANGSYNNALIGDPDEAPLADDEPTKARGGRTNASTRNGTG